MEAKAAIRQNAEDFATLFADIMKNLGIETIEDRSAPETLAHAQSYVSILLVNVPATNLSDEQLDLLRLYAHDLGGGLPRWPFHSPR